ncbi:hypothetical protein MIND_00230100 [Mycena indigotica]|uniref:Uncharacterized protein n=1 Tax=Mycena indigotica TaxID=2126181 RepID=A0A8H6T6W1_9AGAR|nr:uncharacterized protein MIND_00230100 [Mycena indigotica]KAF7312173.1 hypothetical protein MIND_00230100 [Mycena indigotica]
MPESTGLLAGVFNYVAREFESFVVHATGGPNAETDEDEQLTNVSVSSGTAGRRSKTRRAAGDSPHSTRSPSPSPTAIPSILRRRHSISMPGSLFPRTSSLEPDSPPAQSLSVRFASDVPEMRGVDVLISRSDKNLAKRELELGTRYSAAEKGKARATESDLDVETPGVRVDSRETSILAHDRERELDKEKIRLLEEEVSRLKHQLSTHSFDFVSPPPPPPPPPPLPPPNVGIRAPTALYGAARASLKSKMAEEESLNQAIVPRRQGMPTVGVPAEKMADFLAEMKTVRLKKTPSFIGTEQASSPSISNSAGSMDNRANKSRLGSRNAEILRKLGQSTSKSNASISNHRWSGEIGRSFSFEPSIQETVGEKRKRIAEMESDSDGIYQPQAKRRSSSSASLPYSTSSTIISESYPPLRHAPPQDTPSLCSDVGREDEDDSDDRFPSTPPLPIMPGRKVFVRAPGQRQVDVDMTDDNTITPPRSKSTDMFAMRPPTSPMPPVEQMSPRKPRPPGRTPRRPPATLTVDDDEDELSIGFGRSLSKNKPLPSLSRSSKASSVGSTSSLARKARHQPTLEEELRNASWSEEDLDSGVLIGVGGRPQNHSFLARGGAGGEPVVMGVGYIQPKIPNSRRKGKSRK